MSALPVLQRPWPGVYCWTQYSENHRVELSAGAVHGPEGLVVFDPIPLAESELEELCGQGLPVAIAITNGNHLRDAPAWQHRFQIPVYVPAGLDLEIARARFFDPPHSPLPGWDTFPLSGAGPAETAFLLPDRSIAVFGDAIINLIERGLELLPHKYSSDPVQLRVNLREMVNRDFDYALMAHGEPIRKDASRRISALL